MVIKVVTPKLLGSTLAYSPLRSPRITPSEGGIDLNHRDAGERAFADLRLVSIFSSSETGNVVYFMLTFLHGVRRPYLTAGNTIHFNAFPFAGGDTLVPQLRAFALYLHDNNPQLAVDRLTYEFLKGRPPQTLVRDPGVLATALAELLEKVDAIDGGA